MERYAVQERFEPWGREGQERLAAATAVVVGLGGLGGLAAALLARAGVGRLRLVDPDRVALDNLHRQMLYDEADAAGAAPKALAAARHLGAANRGIAIEPVQAELTAGEGAGLLAGADVALDCLDRPGPRFTLNRLCIELGLPWVHAGVVAAQGQVLVIRPGVTPCLRCWFPHDPEPAMTTASHGVIGPAPALLSSLQAAEALKLLLGRQEALLPGLLSVNLWPPRFSQIGFRPPAGVACPDCGGPPAA